MEKLIRIAVRFLAVLSAIAVVVMVIAIAIDVFARNITGASLPGMIEIAETAMVTAVAFGLAWAGLNGEHVAVSLVTDRFGPGLTRATNVFVWTLVTLYTGWLSYANIMRAIDSFIFRETRFGIVQWPMYPMRWILAIGLLSLLLVAVLNLVRTLRGQEPTGHADEVQAALADQPDVVSKTSASIATSTAEGGRAS
ncbi:TRAP transporter small permease [Auritidibacter ignavus]|uniref:TRAP transporter small permease n=1 Tax=Auritidibacter ignavus TaxID=678932 RepID=A0AAJ6AMC1_9MICC|nr:TRAP transporter small permease [Auritidibacter ignavus]WGH83154.1 TRAP transporter small permease [Auritidibacter ignavus]WGH85749.1 TRAP transporter small permease [Auritidibacter ignavus]WGH88036.1 TRAP transporter small permease [Auritidibacter ignavus]WGH92725.1 TRAP transporter small permease [Auritidibacter ignavus]